MLSKARMGRSRSISISLGTTVWVSVAVACMILRDMGGSQIEMLRHRACALAQHDTIT